MTAAVLGPYDHRGPYQDPEFFDTSGTEISFCNGCEHDPCVAGGHGWCGQPPRFITVQAISAQIEEAADELRTGARAETRELWLGFMMALHEIEATAWTIDFQGDQALKKLARIREHFHQAIAERGEDAS